MPKPKCMITKRGGNLAIAAERTQFKKWVNGVKAIPGRQWHPSSKTWSVPATPVCALAAIKTMSHDFEVNVDVETLELESRAKSMMNIIKANADELGQIDTKIPQRPHQRIGFHLIKTGEGSFPTWDMGTGKTKVIVDIADQLGMRRVLVTCPKSVIPHWPREFAKHSEGDFVVLPLWRKPGRKTQMTVREKAKLVQQHLNGNFALVVVVNYQSIWREPLASVLSEIDWDLWVADESTNIKDPNGKCSKWFHEHRFKARKRVALSGTPIQSTPLDLFGQCRWVDPGVFGDSISLFKQLYTVQGEHNEILAWKNQELMNRRFSLISHRVLKDEVLDLPEFKDQEVLVQLGDEARELYEQVENNFIAQVEEGVITVKNALVELLRLQQISSGAAKFDDDDEPTKVDTAKKDALIDIMNSLDPHEPIVVFCIFKFELNMVHEAAKECGRTSCELSGSRNELEEWQFPDMIKPETMKEQYKGKEPTVIAVQLQSGGLGIDLTRACYNVYLSTGFSYGTIEQSRARSNRQGQERPGFYISIRAENTVDQVVKRVLERKAKTASAVVDGHSPQTNIIKDVIDGIRGEVVSTSTE